MKSVVEVFINNDLYGIYSKEAYWELVLQMSTGDYNTHKTLWRYQKDDDFIIDLEDIICQIEADE